VGAAGEVREFQAEELPIKPREREARVMGKRVCFFLVLALWAFSTAVYAEKGATTSTQATSEDETTVSKDWKPVNIVRPKQLSFGSSVNRRLVPNLEVHNPNERMVLLAPDGCINLALGKPVSASDEKPVIGELKQVTDGDKLGPDGSYVELGPGSQWVQIDLGQEAAVYGVVLWHYFVQRDRVYYDVTVRTADDEGFTRNVRTLYNNDHDNSSGLGAGKDKAYRESYEGRIIQTKGEKTRYVRLYSNGNTTNELNQYIEVEVWGRAVK